MGAIVIYIAAAALIAYAVYATVQKFRGKSKSSCCGTAEAVLAKPVDDTDASHYPYRYNVAVDGMMCSNCAANVANAINAMGDVWATVNLGKHRAEVLSKTERSESDFESALKGTGYKATSCERIDE